MNSKEWTPAWHKQQITAYTQEQRTYAIYARLLRRLLSRACLRYASEGHAFAREKTVASFAEKAIRKFERYPDPIHQFTDLSGARVVVLTQQEADRIALFIRRNFVIDEDNSEDVRTRLEPNQFGYRAIHYVVQLPWIGLVGHGKCRSILEEICEDPAALQKPRQLLQVIGDSGGDRLLRIIFEGAFGACEDAVYDALKAASPPLMDPEGIELLKDAVEQTLVEERLARRGPLDLICRIGNRKAEIQVQTVLQHAWSAISHDRLYKPSCQPPPELERRLRRVAALLEESDDQFGTTISELRAYQLDYGNYLSADQIENEIAKWQAVADHDKGDAEVALKIAEYAKAIERWEDIAKLLSPLESIEDPRVLRLLGLARNRLSRNGRGTLMRASKAAPTNPEVLYLLAGTFCQYSASCEGGDCSTALQYYAEAVGGVPLQSLDPTESHVRDPRAFKKYIECMICSGRCQEVCGLMIPALEAAWKVAWHRSEVHVRAPESLYDLGFFALMLGQQHQSLGAYSKAVFLSDTDAAIVEELGILERLRTKLAQTTTGSINLMNWDCAIRFLRLARVAKLQQIARQAPQIVKKREEQRETRQKELAELKAGLATRKKAVADRVQMRKQFASAKEARWSVSDSLSLYELRQALKAAEEAVREADKAVADVNRLVDEAHANIQSARANAASALREFQDMKFHTQIPAPFAQIERGPVILVGGCDPSSESLMQSYRTLLLDAFERFSGVICSGGTEAGIAALAGDIQVKNKSAITTVGYLPNLEAGKKAKKIPDHVTEDTRYTFRIPTTGDDFSPLEPLQYWTDIVAAGIEPYQVRVLGINGGEIAALEYRLALAFDASVAVLERSGREAARLLQNEEWGLAERLMVLPAETAVVQAYVRVGRITPPPDFGELSKDVAKDIHADYVAVCLAEQRQSNPSIREWEELTEDLKDSNYQQALHWIDHLKQCEFSVTDSKVIPAPPFELTDNELERVAELEHARFLVERFLKGWRWGEKRDVEKKINPTLVGWGKLPESEKAKDRAAVRKSVEHLTARGFIIERNGAAHPGVSEAPASARAEPSP